ncbi:MAG TPA: GNAT family N-acetyltransferase [Thermomicrobiales bacterium]|nr:GNAT family N-acetyltransferase [Thermomicrobiales bacterium]
MPDHQDSVTLRRAIPDDAPMLVALRALPITRRHQPTVQHDLATMKRLLADAAARPLAPDTAGKLTWIIEHDGTPAGWISLDVTSREHATGAVGYTLRPAYHGLRVASRALRLLIPIAFDPAGLALERLEANVSVANPASRRVLEAAGFRHEGTARGLLLIHGERVDHDRFGLLQSDLPEPGHS